MAVPKAASAVYERTIRTKAATSAIKPYHAVIYEPDGSGAFQVGEKPNVIIDGVFYGNTGQRCHAVALFGAQEGDSASVVEKGSAEIMVKSVEAGGLSDGGQLYMDADGAFAQVASDSTARQVTAIAGESLTAAAVAAAQADGEDGLVIVATVYPQGLRDHVDGGG